MGYCLMDLVGHHMIQIRGLKGKGLIGSVWALP